MPKILLALVLGLGIIIIGLSTALFLYNPPTTPPPTNTPVVAPDHKNITYVIEKQQVVLVNGYAQMPVAPGSASKIVTKYFGNEAVGDLNGDSKVDTAFLLTQETDGTGTFYYFTVALKTDSGYTSTNTIFLGDRIAPQNTQISDGKITVNYADRKPNEPMSATPSVGVSRYFKVENGMLVEQMDSGTFDRPITFVINQKVKFADGLVVTLKEINDSRCINGRMCVWAGELSPVFNIIGGDAGNTNQEVRLGTTTAKQVTKNGYVFDLKDAKETYATITIAPVVVVKETNPTPNK